MVIFNSNLIKVILVEPAGPINIGSVARLCKNYGIGELRIVAPRCDPFSDEAKNMAVKGKTLLKNSMVFPDLMNAISDCSSVIATSGREENGDLPFNSPQNVLNWLSSSINQFPIAFVFGREDHGLTNQELLLANKIISLKTSTSYVSLNLSHAVAIILHEINQFNQLNNKQYLSVKNDPASPFELENCLSDAKELLLNIGFLLPHTSKARMAKLKQLLQRGDIRSEEVALIRGMVRQVRWTINKKIP